MKRSKSPYFSVGNRIVSLVLFLVLAAGLPASSAGAQQGDSPVLRITRVDTANFPDVRVFVYGRDLGEDFAEVPLIVRQDGVDQVVAENALVDVGTQLVLLVDASEDILSKGQTGDPRYVEVSNAVTRLVDQGVFSPATDWMATYAPAPEESIQPITEWTRDHGAVRNDLYLFEPQRDIGETPLNKLLFYGLDSFDNLTSPNLNEGAQRAMVLFSDGVDNLSPEWIDAATDRASEMNVAIHTVMLGEGTRESRSNLERIAATTNGRFVELSSPDALDDLFQEIAAGSDQRLVGYRSAVADPTTVAVAAQLEQGEREARAPLAIESPVRAVEPVIQQPSGNSVVQRSGDQFGASLDSLTPATLPVAVVFNWPDGHPRDLRRVEYSIGSNTQVQESEPFGQFDLSIAGLGAGDYALRVKAIDELGLAGEAQPQSIKVTVQTPPPPTETPVPVPTEVPPCQITDPGCMLEQGASRGIFAVAALALALIALLLAIVVLLRKPAVRERTAEAITGTIKAMTQPFSLDRRARGPATVRARLNLFEGSASLPAVIEIHGTNTRFGRDPSLSNVVLDDPRVSRYHCRITEEADGSFRIYDEGSTSGTYVNYEVVDIRGQTLKDGDQIHIGPIGLRFELVGAGAVEDTSAKTEPYLPQFGGASDDDPFKTEPYSTTPPGKK